MKYPLLATLPALMLSACAGLGSPNQEAIARLPVIAYGQPAPANSEFVLHYPAGSDLPIVAKVTGDMLARNDQATLKVRLKQDIFLYRDQISFDGKNWRYGQDVVGGKFVMGLPGIHGGRTFDAQTPGELTAEFNLR